MPQAKTIRKQPPRKSILRKVVSGFTSNTDNPAENLIEFVKILEKIEVTPDKTAFNSKYMRGPDGSVIEY